MKIGFYAFDVGPAKMLAMLAERAKQFGHETVTAPSQTFGAALEPAMFGALASCDVVAGCLSSFRVIDGKVTPTEEEKKLIQALSALPKKIPYVIVEDTPGMALRPYAQEISRDIVAVVTAMPGWVDRISKAPGFAYRKVIYLGPPIHWRESYEQMTVEKNKRYEFFKIRGHERAPLRGGEIIISYAGCKIPRFDNNILKLIVMGGKVVVGEDHFILAFKRHPGEGSVKDNDAFAERVQLLGGIWTLEIGNLSMPELIRSSDITVFAGGNTDSITAAYARIPVLYYWDDEVKQELTKQGVPRSKWFVAEEGGAYKTKNPNEFEHGLRALLSSWGRSALKRRQEKAFPLPEDWDTAPKIISFLEDLTR